MSRAAWALAGVALLIGGCHRRRARGLRCPPAVAAVTNAAVDAAVEAGAPVAVPEIVPRTVRFDDLRGLLNRAPADAGASRLPTARPASSLCPIGDGATAWLGHTPHVPLARVTAQGIQPADEACCEPFAVRGSRWREVDRWGQVVGESTISDGEFYDVSHCIELTLTPEHLESSGLFASASGPWRPSPSLRHDPDLAQWADAVALDRRLGAIPMSSSSAMPLAEPQSRMLFFRWRAHYDAPGGGAGAGDWLVLGGRGLAIAWWHKSRWEVAQLLLQGAGGWRVTPIAVFDLDGDGTPEVIVEYDGGTDWNTVILKREGTADWLEVASSIGGATL